MESGTEKTHALSSYRISNNHIGGTAVQRTLAVLTSDQMISNFCSIIWTVIKLEHYQTDFRRENLNRLGQEMEF